MNNNETAMGIYVHIPFCIKKCNYCDFLSFPVDEALKPLYIDALCSEIREYGSLYGKNGSHKSRKVSTVFFGGGTPSIMESKYIFSIINTLHDCFDFSASVEITMECNPGTLNLLKLSDYKYAGINRLSIGLQSACDKELLALGRIHSYTGFMESFKDARKAGFDNINIDIMSALPGQTLSSYTDTLKKVLSFEPEHISAYSLIIEENTPFFDIYNNYKPKSGYLPLPDEDCEREMYYKTHEILSLYNYQRYEISNYCRPDMECRHNLAYWRRFDYLGFGLGASSFMNNVRFKNISDMKQYIENPMKKEETIPLSINDSMAEFMFLGLRTISGISKSEFKNCFNADIYSIYGTQLQKFKNDGLISENNDNIFLTSKGIDLSNYVFSDFII